MTLHLVGGAVGDLAAVIEHGDPLGNVHHHRHVVLDQDDRRAPFPVHLEDEARHVLFFFLVHAAHRLVEQQELRVERQRAAELDPLAQTIGEAAGRLLAQILQLEELDQLLDPGAVRHLLALRHAPIDDRRQHSGAHPHVAAEHDVVEHGHAAEQSDVLKGAGDAERGDARGPDPGHVPALEPDRAGIRPVEAADDVEHRGLAGAVRADDRGQPAAAHLERHVLDRAHAAEMLRDAEDREQRLAALRRRMAAHFARHGYRPHFPTCRPYPCRAIMAVMMRTQSVDCNRFGSAKPSAAAKACPRRAAVKRSSPDQLHERG